MSKRCLHSGYLNLNLCNYMVKTMQDTSRRGESECRVTGNLETVKCMI